VARRTVENHWFVSLSAPKQGPVKTAFVRRTETFSTETGGKQFAKEMLAEQHHSAGTLIEQDELSEALLAFLDANRR